MENGVRNVYEGSTVQELQDRFSKHKWKKMIESTDSKINVKRVYADVDVQASRRGTMRAARSEAVRAPEQEQLDRTKTEVEKANDSRAPGDPETKILNERRAASDAAKLKQRHNVTMDEEWEAVKKPGAKAVLPKIINSGMAILSVWDAYRYAKNENEKRYTMAPYILEDEGGFFTVEPTRTGWFSKRYEKVYFSGELEGQRIEIEKDDFKFLKKEAEGYWGKTDWKGEFVPGLLNRKLPCETCA